jgi:UDP-4-amino-4,6-dideoxy-N-acetyl-beta-L-altrosamine N-acetyltransferase
MDIKLRNISEQDLEQIRAWRNSPEVSQYMYTDALISKEQQIQWFQKIQQDASCRYWIIEYDNKDLGLASITTINKTLNSCYWAFYLGDSSVRGKGIGAKVEYSVLQYVFEELKLNKLCCEVFNFNDSVIKMHEKFGFKREAYYREHCEKNGTKLDVIGLAILKSEWIEIRTSLYEKIYRFADKK